MCCGARLAAASPREAAYARGDATEGPPEENGEADTEGDTEGVPRPAKGDRTGTGGTGQTGKSFGFTPLVLALPPLTGLRVRVQMVEVLEVVVYLNRSSNRW